MKPTGFRLFGKVWKIEWVRMPKMFGECLTNKCLVKINPKRSPEQQRDTLVHEVGHAIDDELQLNLKEEQIRRFTTAMFHWMRDNRPTVEWLMDETEAA